MKRHLSAILFTVMLCSSLFCTDASANSWGLTGKLYQAVEQSKAWDDYTTLSNQDTCPQQRETSSGCQMITGNNADITCRLNGGVL